MHRKSYNQEYIIIDEAVQKFQMDLCYLRKLIEKELIRTIYLDGKEIIPSSYCKLLDFLFKNPQYQQDALLINYTYFIDFCPELIGYLPYHDFIDCFCWLIKFYYSDKSEIIKKHYKLDILFQRFLAKNQFNIRNLEKKTSKKL